MASAPLDDDELVLLHDMIRDYDRARWFRGQLKVWIMWCVGLPAVALGFLQAIDQISKLVKGHGP